MTHQEIRDLLYSEVKPALGCTEPIAVALATANCCETLRERGFQVENIKVEISANILKNGLGVGIPGTGMVGLDIAIALACVCGDSSLGLEVLKGFNAASVTEAKKMVEERLIKVELAKVPDKLYVKAQAYGGGHIAYTILKGSHDSIVERGFDNTAIFSADQGAEDINIQANTQSTYDLTVKSIFEFIQEMDLSLIEDLMIQSVELNSALVKEGLTGKYGLKVGKTLLQDDNKCVYGENYLIYAMAHTAAACDARMDGCTLSAMSNSGSGNQGITATVPVISIAEQTGSTHEELMRALTLSHLIAIHIKHYLGKLSALCGCVVASTGAACGIVYLRKGDYKKICYAIKNMMGNITGMLCDGAKVGCSLKVASGVSSALQSAVLALEEISTSATDGIIEDDIEKTIANIGSIGSIGMQSTDDMILKIMTNK